MSKLLLPIILLMSLVGCGTTVPVIAKFPEVPDKLLEKCNNLNKIPDDAKLSDIAKNITGNYTLYHECSAKNDAWIEWYTVQKKIYESVK